MGADNLCVRWPLDRWMLSILYARDTAAATERARVTRLSAMSTHPQQGQQTPPVPVPVGEQQRQAARPPRPPAEVEPPPVGCAVGDQPEEFGTLPMGSSSSEDAFEDAWEGWGAAEREDESRVEAQATAAAVEVSTPAGTVGTVCTLRCAARKRPAVWYSTVQYSTVQ